MIFAHDLQAKRKSLFLSQQKLATLLGVHICTVQRWERRKGVIPEKIARRYDYAVLLVRQQEALDKARRGF